MFIEDESCFESSFSGLSQSQFISVEDESCFKNNIQESIQFIFKFQSHWKKVHFSVSCIITPYHKFNLQSWNSPSIMLIKHIHKGDLISLIFVNLLSETKVNFMNIDADSSKDPPEILEYYRNLADIFSKKEAISLSSYWDHLDHHISLEKDVKFIFDLIYNLLENEFKVLKNYLEDKFIKDLIYLSISSFDFSVLFVKKSDDNLRLCVDYRALNWMIIKNWYSISLIIEIMNQIRNAKKFTYMNIHDVFHWMYIIENDKYKTIFRIRYNHFEYLIIFFILCNTSIIFQFYINDILYKFLDEFCVVYLNDILIYIDNIHEEYIQYVHQIL
jgi:hypothetical protein